MRPARFRAIGLLLVLGALVAAACAGVPEVALPATPTPRATLTPPDTPSPTATEPPVAATADPAPSPSPTPNAATPIPNDPEVTIDTLANGLTYYVQENDSPGGRAALRLVVDAGSAQEDDDQSGVAHFLEHLLFNGTQAFPENELIATLESFGAEFGPDVNAYTSFDETVYELSVPVDDPAIVATALDVLREWASRATLTEADVVGERGVVLDEWRQRAQGTDGRQQEALLNLLLEDTGYEGRAPIGDPAAISAMTPDPLRRFYEDWYRPDLMAVVVVGDIDSDDMVAAIEERFADLEGPDDPRPRPELSLGKPPVLGSDSGASSGGEVRASTLLDPDLPTAFGLVLLPGPARGGATEEERYADLLAGVALEAIAQRLQDDVTRGEAAFSSAESLFVPLVRPLGVPGVAVNAAAPDLAGAVEAVLTEWERARRFGFSDREIARIVAQVSAGIEQSYASRNSVQDRDLAGRYVAHFLTGTAIPDPDTAFALDTEQLATVTPEAVADALVAQLDERPPAILFVAPEGTSGLATATMVRTFLAGLGEADLNPRPDDGEPITELLAPPEPVAAVETIEYDALPATELRYPNGVRVIVMATDIAENGVALSAASPGGLGAVADADVATLMLADAASEASGLGPYDGVQLDEFLSTSTAQLLLGVTPSEEVVEGSAASEDLEVLFQLVHLAMTAPRVDQAALDAALQQVRPLAENPDQLPPLAAFRELLALRYPGEPRVLPFPEAAELDDINAASGTRLLAERFANAADFVFVVVGDADPGEVERLADTYLATLPGDPEATETYTDLDPGPPPGIVTATVEAGTDPQGAVRTLYTAPLQADADLRLQVDVLERLVGNRLRERVREELSATYSPQVDIQLDDRPDEIAETLIEITGAPEDLDAIAEATQEVLAELRAAPPDEAVTIALEQVRRDLELVSNGYFIDTLLYYAQHPDEDLADETSRSERLDEITAADLAALATAIWPASQYIEVRSLPA